MADRSFFAALLLCTAAARGEDRFGDKGQVVPFGGVGYSHTSSSGRSTDSLAVAPGAVWFVADHIGVGLSASVGYRSGSGLPSGVVSSAVTSVGIAPTVAAVVPLAERVALFPQLTAGLSWQWSSGQSAHNTTLQAFAPFVLTSRKIAE